MKNILVPTDLSIQSLNIVHAIVNKQQQPVRIFLVHLLDVPVDPMDLLFLKAHRQQQPVPGSFTRSVHQLSEQYRTSIASIGLKFYYGNRASVLHSIVENHQIDTICLLKDHSYTLPLKDSIDMIGMINHSKVPVHRIQMNEKVLIDSEPRKVSATFFKKDYSSVM